MFRVGEQFGDDGCLLVQRRQVGGAGYVAANGAVPFGHIQRGGIVGDGGAQDGDLVGGGDGYLQGHGGVGQDQVHLFGDKAVDDGAAVGVFACGVLASEFHIFFTQCGDHSILKAVGCRVQGGVLCHLADTDQIVTVVPCRSAAGRKGQEHQNSQRNSEGLLHGVDLLLYLVETRFCVQYGLYCPNIQRGKMKVNG